MLLGVAGCGRTAPPAPVEVNAVTRSPQGPPGSAPPAMTTNATTVAMAPTNLGARDTSYVVQRGDTAYAVARRFDIPVKALIDANNLQPPYGVQAGQRLVVPRPRGHMVEPGDTVSSVAHRYGVDMSTLVRVNDLRAPYALQTGQRLALPAPVAGGAQQAVAASPPVAPSAPPPAASRPVEVAVLPPPLPSPPPEPAPVSAKPVPIAAPAPPPPAPAATIAAAPPPATSLPAAPMVPPSTARPTAAPPPAVKPPEPIDRPVAAAEPPAPAAPSTASPPPTTGAPAPPAQLAAAAAPAGPDVAPPVAPPVEPTVAAPPPVRDTAPVGPPPPRAGKTFLWPLRGRVIATFGEQGSGVHNDGLNIAAPRGTPIRAAENGVVVYAGNEIRGFGNLLLVRHAGGYVTAYAHAETLLVKRGDTVHRGQVIARVGATGSVTEPQLHFEIREGSQPVDPQRYLGSPSA